MAVAQQVSIEEFEKMTPPEDGRLELVDGEVVRWTFPTPKHNRIEGRLYRLLQDFAEPLGLGLVFSSDAGYILSREPPTLRGPDVSFLRAERAEVIDFEENIPGAPDLAVEILSPNDKAIEVRKKVDQYLAAGARAVWVLYPETREVEVSEPDRRRHVLAADDVLEAPEILPGFRIAVRDLFPDAGSPAPARD